MGACTLRLYRDAAQPAMAELGRNLERAAARPGLSIVATEDHLVGTDEQRRRASARAGAEIAELSTDWATGGSPKTHNGAPRPSTTSGQEWDESDTQKITISNKLSARYQRRRRAIDR